MACSSGRFMCVSQRRVMRLSFAVTMLESVCTAIRMTRKAYDNIIISWPHPEDRDNYSHSGSCAADQELYVCRIRRKAGSFSLHIASQIRTRFSRWNLIHNLLCIFLVFGHTSNEVPRKPTGAGDDSSCGLVVLVSCRFLGEDVPKTS